MSTVRAQGGTTERGWDEPRRLRRQEVSSMRLDGEPSGTPYVMVEEVNRAFAMRADALAWIDEMRADGYGVEFGPSPLATFRYAGPTDSPSNAWSVRVVRILDET